MNGRHISEESIIVQYTFPYNDGFHVKNGSFQSKLKEPVIEMVSSTSLKVLMEARVQQIFYAYGMGNAEKSLESLICERSSSIRLFLSTFRMDIARIIN
jgi:hypothetical protein